MTHSLPPADPAWAETVREAAGLKRLTPGWAKAEIILGLAAACLGIRLLVGPDLPWAGGLLVVFGGYLAMAGHRSHLYQSLNQQTAYLLRVLVKDER